MTNTRGKKAQGWLVFTFLSIGAMFIFAGGFSLFWEASGFSGRGVIRFEADLPSVRAEMNRPLLMLTEPEAGALLKQFPVRLATDMASSRPVQGVYFFVNGALLCVDSIAPYSCRWPLPGKAGNFVIKTQARLAGGEIVNASPVLVSVAR